MRLFLYEYMTAIGPADEGAKSLGTEGWAMLSAVVEDFGRLPGVQTTALLRPDVRRQLGTHCIPTRPHVEEDRFKQVAASSDYTLVIAPELDGLLEQRCRWVLEAGGRLLGSNPHAVTLTADKLALAEHFRTRSVPTPATVPLSSEIDMYPAVCKPRRGAGSQDTYLVRNAAELTSVRATAQFADLIVQPYMPGQAASVVFLVGSNGMQPLLPATQELSTDGRFHYLGGRMPLRGDLAERAIELGRRAIQAVPGLRGYVGVDLVFGPNADGSLDTVIEINPRLTTSYIGLRRLARGNLAAAMLACVGEANIQELLWHSGSVAFHPDGRVEWL
jgi:tyramine---L-glutamate ligase